MHFRGYLADAPTALLDLPEIYVFTDGLPKEHHTKRSAWAVEPAPDSFARYATAHTRGLQTISRAELIAVVWIAVTLSAKFPHKVFYVYTDSQ